MGVRVRVKWVTIWYLNMSYSPSFVLRMVRVTDYMGVRVGVIWVTIWYLNMSCLPSLVLRMVRVTVTIWRLG